jgi:hypothetical protein
MAELELGGPVRRIISFVVALLAGLILVVAGGATPASAAESDRARTTAGLFGGAYVNPSAPKFKTISVPTGGIGPMVSGGGCQNVLGGKLRPCISVWTGTTNPIRSDFYLNAYYSGAVYAVLWTCRGSGCTYHYEAPLNHLGHFPVGFYTATVAGVYFTRVEFYNAARNEIAYGDSPPMNWP